jgi:sec-independent protein translocase protein TatA
MGLENPLHIAIVLVVVLLVFGAKRLPEMGKGLGEGMRGFRKALSGEDDGISHITTASEHRPTPDPVPAATPAPAVTPEPAATPELAMTREPGAAPEHHDTIGSTR